MKRGPAYRTGGIYFTNHYPNVCTRIQLRTRRRLHMRWYAWWFALFNIAVGAIVGIQKAATRRCARGILACADRPWCYYPLRGHARLLGRYLGPKYSAGALGPVM